MKLKCVILFCGGYTEAGMGRLRNFGLRVLEKKATTVEIRDRVGLILGTGWSDPDVLAAEGFELEDALTFDELGLGKDAAPGHPNKILLGTWGDQEIVISQGRRHLYQEDPSATAQTSSIRRWMAVMLALMGQGRRIVLTCSVGGLHPDIKMGMLIQPQHIVDAHLRMPYLSPAQAEFAMSDPLLWHFHEESVTMRPKLGSVFQAACDVSELERFVKPRPTHYLIHGPGFGGAFERRLWSSWGCHTVGMSLGPELRLIWIENWGRVVKDEDPISVFPTLICTDDHDLPDPQEISREAKARAPNLGRFLSSVIAADW